MLLLTLRTARMPKIPPASGFHFVQSTPTDPTSRGRPPLGTRRGVGLGETPARPASLCPSPCRSPAR
jgi:hypothetical protein